MEYIIQSINGSIVRVKCIPVIPKHNALNEACVLHKSEGGVRTAAKLHMRNSIVWFTHCLRFLFHQGECHTKREKWDALVGKYANPSGESKSPSTDHQGPNLCYFDSK